MGAGAEAALTSGRPLGRLPAPGVALPARLDIGPVPAPLDLDRVARSSGQCGLAPFGYDPAARALWRVLGLPAGPHLVRVAQPDGAGAPLQVAVDRVLGAAGGDAARLVRRVLGLDDDLSGLWAGCDAVPSLAWVRAAGAGRLLRTPTVWEALVTTLLAPRWSYAAVQRANTRLVAGYGRGGAAFPTPDALAAAGEDGLRAVGRLGWRAAGVARMAGLVASGLDVEAWYGQPDDAAVDAGLHADLLALPGIGPLGADTVLGLLGRPRGLALDGWAAAALAERVGRPLSPAETRERYAQLGRWAGTGLWLEVTAPWFPADRRPELRHP